MDHVTPREGDQREYYPNRPLAQTAANRGQREFADQGVYSASASFVPYKGFVACLYSDVNIPDAWDAGFEVILTQHKPDVTPEDWAKPKKQTSATGAGPTVGTPPAKGSTKRVWDIADKLHAESPLVRSDRARVVAACEAEGINKSTAGTQWSKWAKDKGL